VKHGAGSKTPDAKHRRRARRVRPSALGPLSVSWRRRIKVSLPKRRPARGMAKRRSLVFPSSLARMEGVLEAATGPPRSRCRRSQQPRALPRNRHRCPHLAAPTPPCSSSRKTTNSPRGPLAGSIGEGNCEAGAGDEGRCSPRGSAMAATCPPRPELEPMEDDADPMAAGARGRRRITK
jgi:hypothetical protein